MTDAPPAAARSRRRRIVVTVAAVVVVAVAAAALWHWYAGRAGRPNGLVLYGNVDVREVRPAFNAAGPVAAMRVSEGATVKKGELIATLDATRYRAALAQAEGQMRSRKAALARLVAGSRPEEIAQAKATMAALAVTARNNKINYRRAVRLARRGAGTVQRRDDARAAAEAAHQQYEAARQAYALALAGPRREDIAAARASFQAAEAAVAMARRELADTKLYAPADGVVENRILEPGDMASPSTPVYTIALPSPLWVRAYVAEIDIGRVALGMTASVTTDSFPGRVYHGWVGFISPTAEFTPKTVETPELRTALVYQVRVFVCDARGELRLGMPATVQIDLAHRPSPTAPGCGPADAR